MKMIKTKSQLLRVSVSFVLISILLLISGCTDTKKVPMEELPISVIPKPDKITQKDGVFVIGSDCKISVEADEFKDEITENSANFLAEILKKSTGYGIEVTEDASAEIKLSLQEISEDPSDEAYIIEVNNDGITISANKPDGLFWAVQTLRQLLPHEVENKSAVTGIEWKVPCVTILDSPEYEYRGFMLDIARHFHPKEVIMRQIDLAVSYKINKLHLHLSDDQGWRIEITSRPELIETGSKGAVNGDRGGYLTKRDYQDIVSYAAERYVEVIPEIDMPGHVNAALASIPELNPDGKSPAMRTDIEVGYSSLDCRSETTYDFVDDVIREISEISPSKYFHVGGDECAATSKEDYKYFFERVCEIANKYGKITIGWGPYDMSDGVKDGAVLQNWLCQADSTRYADTKNLPVILSPPGAYIEHKYRKSTKLGLQWRGLIDLEASYNWYPEQISPNSNVIGIESTVWSETITNQDDMEYLMYPRLLANAEIGWTSTENRGYDEFRQRLDKEFRRLDQLKVNYAPESEWE